MLNNAKKLLNNQFKTPVNYYIIKLKQSQIVQIRREKMKRKIALYALLVVALCVIFAIGISATTTNEFGTLETIPNIDLTDMNTDATSRIVLVDANGVYHTYPAQYVVSSNTKFYYNFKPINDALGTSYNKHSIIRIEVPDNILIATNCGDLSQTNNLVEIKFSPNSQLHTLEYGCFYANKKLEKLNIPPMVTTIGTLIINNSTLKELVFMDGFSATLPKDSFKGASGVEKVVFSNQMTTLEDRALDSTLGEKLKEFYFGASLKNLGTNNMAWVKQSVKFYIPAQFLSEADTITMETFSWWSSSACLPTGVIFYTGSMEQMQKLVAKSTYDRVISPNATLVEWDSTKADSEYVPTSGWTIVYNYNKCKAFYNNTHEEQVLNSCQFGCARGCGLVEMLANPEHSYLKSVLYGEGTEVDYYKQITVCEACVNCKVANGESIIISPLFTNKGYSISLDGEGIAQRFGVDLNAIDKYKKNVNSTFEYGVVASAIEGAIIENKENGLEAGANTVAAKMSDTDFEYLEIKVMNLSKDYPDTKVVCCAYVFDGASVYYLSESKTTSQAFGKTYNSFIAE